MEQYRTKPASVARTSAVTTSIALQTRADRAVTPHTKSYFLTRSVMDGMEPTYMWITWMAMTK